MSLLATKWHERFLAQLKFDQEIVVEGTCVGLKHKGAVTLENCVLR